jgi:hypothetical protein
MQGFHYNPYSQYKVPFAVFFLVRLIGNGPEYHSNCFQLITRGFRVSSLAEAGVSYHIEKTNPVYFWRNANVSLYIFVNWHNLFPSLHIHGLNAKNHFLPTP